MVTEFLLTLSPDLQFIINSALSNIIGNHVTNYFNFLFSHQRENVVRWADTIEVKPKEWEILIQDPKLKRLFSKVISEVINELDEEKIPIWAKATDSIIRNTQIEVDTKKFFINYLSKLDIHAISFLAKCYSGEIKASDTYNENGELHDINHEKFSLSIGIVQIHTTGLVTMKADKGYNYYILTDFGKQFVDFISNYSLEKTTV